MATGGLKPLSPWFIFLWLGLVYSIATYLLQTTICAYGGHKAKTYSITPTLPKNLTTEEGLWDANGLYDAQPNQHALTNMLIWTLYMDKTYIIFNYLLLIDRLEPMLPRQQLWHGRTALPNKTTLHGRALTTTRKNMAALFHFFLDFS